MFSCNNSNTSGNKNKVSDAKNDHANQQSDHAGQTETGGIKSDTLRVADLPATVIYKGKLVKVMGWKDKLGDNLLLLTETGEFASKDSAVYEDNRDAELHVYHYVKTADVWQSIADVNDQISSCL